MSLQLKRQLVQTHTKWRQFSSSSTVLARRGGRRIRHSKAMLATDPVYDAFQEVSNASGSVRVWNDPPPWPLVYQQQQEREAAAKGQPLTGEENDSEKKDNLTSREAIEQYDPQFHLPVARENLRRLHRYPLVEKRVQHQTGKGRIASFYALTVVGNGKGLMGYGEGKGEDINIAREKSFTQAVRSMDTVDRFEERTLWYTLNTKFGATKVIMRPRPVGFGLHCNPNIHQVCKAAGIKDISAKVWGSRNPMNVIKATVKLLHAGNAHLNMGDGVGGKGRRLDKGSGMRGRQALERERGRKIVDYRTW
jgi:small subunit ribosomal protein S5